MSDKKLFMNAVIEELKEARPKDINSKPAAIVPFADWDFYYTQDIIDWSADEVAPGAVEAVKVPIGFVTDLASIPSIFWTVLPPAARYSYPAIIHDYLYWFQPCEREAADDVFKAAMRDMKVDRATIISIYGAVRAGGGRAWADNAVARRNGERRVLKRYPERVDVTWDQWKREPDVFR